VKTGKRLKSLLWDVYPAGLEAENIVLYLPRLRCRPSRSGPALIRFFVEVFWIVEAI